jgi:pimeloyl-ACP methyl ester carboxylesterase
MSVIQQIPERRPRALADIHYNNLINDPATSSEDEAPEIRAIAPAEVQSLVGVSLGRAQTRFILPQTPAAEKQAAIDEQGGFFGGPQIQDDVDLDDDDAPIQETERTSRPVTRERQVIQGRPTTGYTASTTTTGETTVRLPSPWRAGPKKFKKTSESRSVLKDGFHRRASSTGPGPMSGMGASIDHWRDALRTSIHNFTSPFSTQHPQEADTKTRPPNRPRRSGSLFASFASLSSSSSTQNLPTRPRTNHSTASTLVDSHPRFLENVPASSSKELAPVNTSHEATSYHTLQHPKTMPMQRDPPSNESTVSNSNPQFVPIRPASSKAGQYQNALSPMARVNSGRSHRSLRRSASESSLHTFRTLSRVPSLGDDSRFEHVQAQVNSRMKAIRDSWQDTNIRLPLLPSFASLSDISLNRTHSFSKKNSTLSPSTSTSALPSANQKSSTNLPRATTVPQASKTAQQHPNFSKALAELTGDVVVLGGYRGSILRSAEPPHRQLWAPIKVGLNVRKVDLEVGLDSDADERAQEKIIPGGMLTHIGPVDISRRLFKRLRACENARSGELRVHDYGYDWRLDPLFLSKQLIEFLEKLPCNKPGTPKNKRGATVIAHSLGGLITRHAVNQRPELFAGVVYAGVPRTCVNILGPFRNGDDVLLSSRVLTAQVNFTIRTSFALLPLDGRCFFNKETKEEYPVDFFDPQTWIDYRLSPCIARPLPSLNDPPPPTGLAGVMNSMAGVMNSMVPGRKNSISRARQAIQHPAAHAIDGLVNPPEMDGSMASGSSANAEAKGNIDYDGTDNMAPQIDSSSHAASKSPDAAANDPNTSIATTVTIPREQAIAYLTRILANVKQFKTELFFHAPHAEANAYPPAAVIYGKTTPTVYGAKVVSREAIKHASAYDALAFASGDGVVLAKAAMLPDGYKVARGGLVSSERGHVTLLGDLEAVGRCLRAVMAARRKGVGMGAGE